MENTNNFGSNTDVPGDTPNNTLGSTAPVTPKIASWNVSDTTDGRDFYDPGSKYPFRNRVEIFCEALYLATILFSSFYALIWIFGENISLYPTSHKFQELNNDLKKLVAFGVAGLIGGSMFGLKYLYHVTGRGLWHEDRRIWRIYSPWLAAALSVMMAMLIDGGLINISHDQTGGGSPYPKYISIGFMTGYFADTALAKLQEVATVIFGASNKAPATSGK